MIEDDFKQFLNKWESRPRKILFERILSYEGNKKTLKQLAIENDITPERVRQIEGKIIDYLLHIYK